MRALTVLSRVILCALCCLRVTAVAGQSFVDEAVAAKDLSYKLVWQGSASDNLISLLKSLSRLESLEDEPPLLQAGLERRAENDLDLFRTALRSEGYYDNRVSYRLDLSQDPIEVLIEIDPGPAYLLASYNIDYGANSAGADFPKTAPSLVGRLNQRAIAPPIEKAQDEILEELRNSGRPFAQITDRRVVVNHAERTLAVTLTVEPGPNVRFGKVTFDGLTSIDPRYLARFVPWEQGDIYKESELDTLRNRLAGAELFSGVTVDPQDETLTTEEIPIRVTLTEAKHRSVGTSARYSTTEGVGGTIFWEHRNILHEGETLNAIGDVAEIKQEFAIKFLKPNFFRMDQNFRTALAARREDNLAFRELALTASATFDRPIGKIWAVSAGVTAEVTEIRDSTSTETFGVFGLPISARRDTTDDPLDPKRGSRIRARVVPYMAVGDQTDYFLVSEVAASIYQALWNERLVLAARGKIGSIVGTDTGSIPATKRFYSGGGGSVRGYDFKSVGPLDAENEPVGGRSVVEVGAEARIRVTKSIGVVPFIEGGNVFDQKLPNFSDDYQWAAGIGGVYLTPIGPIRVDFAFPINRRPGVDGVFEFYISLGQAF